MEILSGVWDVFVAVTGIVGTYYMWAGGVGMGLGALLILSNRRS